MSTLEDADAVSALMDYERLSTLRGEYTEGAEGEYTEEC